MLKRWGISFALILSMSQIGYALDLELTQGINAALPIGIDALGVNPAAQDVTSIIRHDLNLSGQFKLISATSGSSQAMWRAAGADSTLIGKVQPEGGDQYAIHVELLDTVANSRVLFARDFHISKRELRPVAHFISDLVYEKLTGEKGIFSTRIAYVLVGHAGGRTRYSLEVADADGFNPQSLLSSPEPIMSPAWSPDGRQLACVSFENRRSQIYIIEVETGRRRLVTSFPGINGAPSWAPDGRSLALVLSRSGSPKVYQVDLASGAMKQLTYGSAIDTEPRFSPDNRTLVFTSGRGGSPQIYRLNLQDGQIKRVTFEGNYNAKASLTPNQSKVVMLHREDRRFMIAAQDLISGQLTILSGLGSALDESPSISPNGKMVIYATRENNQGLLEIVSIDGRIHMRLPSKQGDVQEPAWSPYLS